VKEASQHRSEDERRQQLAQARNEADVLIYQAEKALNDLGDRVPATDRATIEQQIRTLRDALQRGDVNEIRSASQTLHNSWYALSQQTYSQDSGSAYGEAEGRESGEDVVEGDFTEA
jgi:molecular chaperone DnaK